MGASRADGTPMTPDTLNLWMSSVKPIAAVAIAQLVERGRLNFDDRVAQHIPEFAQGGKDAITVRHVLTHTGGFRAWPAKLALDDPWDTVIQIICKSPLEPSWVPGEKAGYHPRTGWFILGELVRRLDERQRTYDRYAREEVLAPIEMTESCAGGMTSEQYQTFGPRIGAMFEDIHEDPPTDGDALEGVPDERTCASVHPGASGRGPMRDLGKFYETLFRGGELRTRSRALRSEMVAELTQPQRIGMFDHTFKHAMDWGLGFIVNLQDPAGRATMPYGYGLHASPQTFGHSGAESSCAFCDPEHELVVAWVCNGMPGEEAHQKRQRAINTAIYEDLELVQVPSGRMTNEQAPMTNQ
jgi:CubicO group peptidase (beta-lactamase class C family)